MLGLRTRPRKPGDCRFITSATSMSAKFSFLRAGRRGLTRWTRNAIAKNECVVAVVDVDGEEELLGFVLYNKNELIWCYVKHLYRRNGIMSAMIKGLHLSHYGLKPPKKAICSALERRGITYASKTQSNETRDDRE